MKDCGIPAKERIEGPPPRKCEILLRQTSFKALEESVRFYDDFGTLVPGSHTARFGEVEQRGAALTRKGRALYDKLLAIASTKASKRSAGFEEFDEILRETFEQFPDTWEELRSQGLVFLRYKPTLTGIAQAKITKSMDPEAKSLSKLLDCQQISYEPITYEDFLPVSAAGIFTSNLGVSTNSNIGDTNEDRRGFEQSICVPVADEMDLYEQLQADSLEECSKALSLSAIIP
ncbi:hypothetical protein B7463_g4342, partial [Scytalidium lignicola]